MSDPRDGVLRAVESAAGEMVAFAGEMVRIPTVNPPGENYEECARLIGGRLGACGFEVEYHPALGRAEHTPEHPRLNVVGSRRGSRPGPVVHFNGHLDVVPPGAGWTFDPFAGDVREGRLRGRGSCDMKAGLAAALYAAEALRRAGVDLPGTVEVSGTVDEESGGFAGVAFLCEGGRLSRSRTDYVIIPEPFGAGRICIGHRGVYWFEVTTLGRIAHGSMPFLGVSAIDHMGALLEAVRSEVAPDLARRRTAMPVVPPDSARATINVNAVSGGQDVDAVQTPCVADRCRAIFDRRFLAEEGFEATRREVEDLLARLATRLPGFRSELRDVMVVHPTRTPEGSPLVATLRANAERVLGRPGELVASPGTYDHKHVARIAGVEHCVAYGPGPLEMAHQPDEWCGVADMVASAQVMALTLLDLAHRD
jgi:succinyl-diaminopimelate desuccinylase